MIRRAQVQVLASVLVALVMLTFTFREGNEPLLGLDLQGGISMVLQPTEPVDDDRLDQAVSIIRSRVDGLGVAEPEISTQGDTILVQIPGIDDPDRALELVGQTAELRFRPVLNVLPSPGTVPDGLDFDQLDPEDFDFGDLDLDDFDLDDFDLDDFDLDDFDLDDFDLDDFDPDDGEPGGDGDAVGLGWSPGEQAGGAPPEADPDADQPVTDDSGEPVPSGNDPAPDAPAPGGEGSGGNGPDGEESEDLLPPTGGPTTVPPPPEPLAGDDGLTSREDDDADAFVVLPERVDGQEVRRYELGPTAITGEALEGAIAQLDQVSRWVVSPTLRSGSPGIDDLNAIAAVCFSMAPGCPTGQLAIVLDGEVISAPVIQVASFGRDQIQITGDFSEREARDLALVLRYGALPVELEPQAAQVVSATVGEDALQAGLVAGGIGLALASFFMLFVYRLLGLVAIASLALTAAVLYSIIAWLGETQGLALTLAGVTGLIVAIGVSLDSNVVYFEHLREDVRNGRSLRGAVDRSFRGAFRTIVAADTVSLIGAVILYMLTVGAVRGFAFYLGVATVLDLVASWFFMRPAVGLLGRWGWLQSRPRLLGLSRPRPGTPGAPTTTAQPAGPVVGAP
jgi:preprotein translocase subunit SecD